MTTRLKFAGDLYEQSAQFQSALDALDAKAAQQITNAWAEVYGQIRTDMDGLMGKMAAAQAAGETVKPGWLYQKARMQTVLRTTKTQLAQFGTVSGVVTKGAQAAAVAAAVKHAQKQTQTAAQQFLPGVEAQFTDIDPANLKHLVGTLANGSPLRELFDTIPNQGGRELEARLVKGVALGWNARKIAAHAADGLNLTKQRALLISRTETLRSYREASRVSYEASDVIGGWFWTAALDRRTCVACVAMHGTVHPTTERLDGHPACRCRMVPKTKTYAELGLGDDLDAAQPTVGSGKDWLMAQPVDVQRAIMGPRKWEQYTQGTLSLDDMVARKFDPRWGTMRYERSLSDIAAGKNANSMPQPKGPLLRGQKSDLPEGYFGVDLPEGYYGVKLPITHPAYPLPSPSAKGVAKVLGKINSGSYTKADLVKIVKTGKYKNSAKPLKPEDYSAHKAALDKIDKRAADKAAAQAQQDALKAQSGMPDPQPHKVQKWLDALVDGTFDESELIDLMNSPGKSVQNKANIAEALKQYNTPLAKPKAGKVETGTYVDDDLDLPPAVKPLGNGSYTFDRTPFDVDDLTLDPTVKLGGAHTKAVYTDKNGVKWLYKPQDEFRAQVDVSVNTLQQMVGLKAPRTYTVQINGRTGSIQELLPSRNAFGDSPSLFDPSKLQAHDVLELQKHDLFDWLVSNHDGHAQQFIRGKGPGGPGNPVIGIDKGQAFRFFGKDRLDYTYEPNAQYGVTKVANILNRETARGKPPAGWQSVNDPDSDLRRFAEQIKGLDDDQYAAILRPYAEQAQARGMLAGGDVDKFLRNAVDRKNSIVDDYAKYHARIEDERDKALGQGKYRPAPPPRPEGLQGMAGAKEFTSQQQAHAYWAQVMNHTEMRKRLNAQELAAINKYTGSSYRQINDALRSGNVGPAVQGLVDRLNSAMDKVADLITEDVIVHRAAGTVAIQTAARNAGISMSHPGDMQAVVGTRLADPGFMSSSVGHTPAYGDRSVVLKVRVPAGTRGIYVSQGLSAQGQGEYEFVMASGYEFHVHDARRTTKHAGHMYGESWELDVELIPTAKVGKPKPKAVTRRKAAP